MNDFRTTTTVDANATRRDRWTSLSPWLLVGIAACACIGCKQSADGPRRVSHGEAFGDERLEYVVGNLQRLEGFDDEAMQGQIVAQLNAWVRGRKPPQGWEIDPMVESLPETLREQPLVSTLGQMEFHRYDGVTLYEATALRDVGDWAAGDQVDPLAQAKNLFDWTVRNIQLEAPPKEGASAKAELASARTPWRTLLFGRGTAVDRAWVFLTLLRQRSIDAAVVQVPEAGTEGRLRTLVAVLVEGKVYLFDPLIGLPIPKSDGIRVDPKAGLSVEPATLAEVNEKPDLLRALDLDAKTPYPVEAESLKNVTVLLEASPASLSARMDLLESRLVGDNRMILTVFPTALAERFKKNHGVKSVALWKRPFEVVAVASNPSEPMRRAEAVAMRPFRAERRIEQLIDRGQTDLAVPQAQAPFMRYGGAGEENKDAERRVTRASPLWRARILYFKGDFVGEDGATRYFQMARPSDDAISGIAAVEASDEADRVGGAALKAAWERAKQDASYWLGLMNFERAKYGPAVDYFVERVLGPSQGNSESSAETPWASGATYNLARTYEAEGRFPKQSLHTVRTATTPTGGSRC